MRMCCSGVSTTTKPSLPSAATNGRAFHRSGRGVAIVPGWGAIRAARSSLAALQRHAVVRVRRRRWRRVWLTFFDSAPCTPGAAQDRSDGRTASWVRLSIVPFRRAAPDVNRAARALARCQFPDSPPAHQGRSVRAGARRAEPRRNRGDDMPRARSSSTRDYRCTSMATGRDAGW